MTKTKGRGKKIALTALAVVIGLAVLALIVLNVCVRVAFSGFYNEAREEFKIPGIDSDFVCQDLDHLESSDSWLFSGYSSNGKASPVYRLDSDATSTRIYVKNVDGSLYDGHGSGITSDENHVFLTCDAGYLVFDAKDFVEAGDNGCVQAIDEVALELTPAFLNIENGSLYAGTFHLIPDYPAPDEHHMTAPDGSQNAGIVLAYPEDSGAPYGFSHTASRVYSIPDAAQGICAFENGDIMISSSYGLSASHLRTYATSGITSTSTFMIDGEEAPLFFLDSTNEIADITAPPMTEGIEAYDGRVYVSEESASNKYVFGKLYGAGWVYSIPAPGRG